VGLLCGPSGCGKSSLVKAGLLPRLAPSVVAVYVEATAAETEARLLTSLRKQCPGLPADLGLKEALAALRRGQGVPAGKKVLLVLDQFEQWLHAGRAGSVSDRSDPELVQALRQCEGGRVQALALVRDDFWMAVICFLRELEVPLVEGHNSAAVDLFPLRHAQKVLAAFGRAFGALPEAEGKTSPPQQQFVEQAVAGLAQEGKVVCVRLALFAEMMKGQPWTPASLKEAGGTEGVGVAFLEETFSAAGAPPAHRYHQKAARAVLQALLPEVGSDLKGTTRSRQDLLEASGYVGRPREFDDLLCILDSELRLITPTDLEGVTTSEPAGRYYQLTHDYPVPSLREWLTRKQKETRRGRAELLLADRAAVWNARPENRQLPSLLQWLQIRRWTTKKTWTPPQRQMMRKATRYHLVRGGLAVALLLLLALLGRDGWGRVQAHHLRDRLVDANTAEVDAIVQDMAPYRRWINPLLREEYARAYTTNDRRMGLHTSLALAPVDPGQKAFLYNRLLLAQPQEVIPIRKGLQPFRAQLTEQLWRFLANRQEIADNRFRVACALADYTPHDPRWETVREDVAAHLVVQPSSTLGAWAEALRPVGPTLLVPLAAFLEDERNGSDRAVIADLYKTLAANQPDAFARLEQTLAQPSADVAASRRRANVAVALVVMGRAEIVWPLLKQSPNPTLRSYLIDRLAPGGGDANVLLTRLEREPDVSIRRALLLSLGEFGLDRWPAVERRKHIPWLLEVYRQGPDPGSHGAVAWLLRQWQAEAEVRQIDKELTGKDAGKRQWFVNRQGQTMVLAPQPGEFWMGQGPERRKQRLDHGFAIAATDVTLEQFQRFRPQHKNYGIASGAFPVDNVSWCQAAEYCNWLSQQEGLPREEWCYEPNEQKQYAAGMKIVANYFQRRGYRLPTEAEWEYACRTGAETTFGFGEAEELLPRYGWFFSNALAKSQPVGQLRPNDLGLFDMHGNVWQWCQDRWQAQVGAVQDQEEKLSPHRDVYRVLRGGAWDLQASYSRAAFRFYKPPTSGFFDRAGFRVVMVPRP
jgi:formylglycine-generating enzyme required for sulfatase activity